MSHGLPVLCRRLDHLFPPCPPPENTKRLAGEKNVPKTFLLHSIGKPLKNRGLERLEQMERFLRKNILNDKLPRASTNTAKPHQLTNIFSSAFTGLSQLPLICRKLFLGNLWKFVIISN